MSVTFRKIRADEIKPGMMVARHRSHSYKRVTATEALPVTTRIVFGETAFGNMIRPRHGVMLWVREEAAEEARTPTVREVEPNGTRYYDDDCGQSWDDALGTSRTPAPAGRCPFEYEHVYDD